MSFILSSFQAYQGGKKLPQDPQLYNNDETWFFGDPDDEVKPRMISFPWNEYNTNSMSYLFERTRNKIREDIKEGKYDGVLIAERELAKKLKTNPKTLNKALNDLVDEGLLIRQVGIGTRVASDLTQEEQRVFARMQELRAAEYFNRKFLRLK